MRVLNGLNVLAAALNCLSVVLAIIQQQHQQQQQQQQQQQKQQQHGDKMYQSRHRRNSDVEKLLEQCSQISTLTGYLQQSKTSNGITDVLEINMQRTIQFKLALQQTACFWLAFENEPDVPPHLMKNGSLLLTIKYTGVTHVYPVRASYMFAIPLLTPSCVCDCGIATCNKHRQQCPTNHLCYWTEHVQSQNCRMCCRISVSPLANTLSHAVLLGYPSFMAGIEYQLITVDGNVSTQQQHRVNLPLNSVQQVHILEGDRLQAQITGAQPHPSLLQHVWYWTLANETNLRTGPPINALHETDMNKLGWLRTNKHQQWHIHKGQAKMQNAHQVTVTDCYDQVYEDMMLVEQFAIRNPTGEIDYNYNLGHLYNSLTPSFGHMALIPNREDARQLSFQQTSGHFVEMDLNIDRMRLPVLVYRDSYVGHFRGEIMLDKFSNHFLNVTFFETKGLVVGRIYHNDHAEVEFSARVMSAARDRQFIQLPTNINGARTLCVHPQRHRNAQKCRVVHYREEPVGWFSLPEQYWMQRHGHCTDCAEPKSDADLVDLINPINWTNMRTDSITQKLSVAFKVVSIFLALLLFIAFMRHCVCPLWKCAFGGMRSKKHKRSAALTPSRSLEAVLL